MLDSIMFFVFIERGSRYTLFLFCYMFDYVKILNYPLLDFYKQSNLPTMDHSTMLKRIKMFHKMFTFYLRIFSLMNQKAIKTIYAHAITTHLFVSVSFISGLIVRHYESSFRYTMLFICVCEFIIGYAAVSLLITVSSSLTKPVSNIFKFMNATSLKKDHSKIKSGLLYEMFYTRKPFKFQLGPFGAISRKNIFTFCIFYSSQMMFFIRTLKDIGHWKCWIFKLFSRNKYSLLFMSFRYWFVSFSKTSTKVDNYLKTFH